MATSHCALAQTAPLISGGSLTYNSLTYTVSACSYVLLGTAQADCSVDNAVLEVIGTGSRASIEVVSDSTGSPVLSIASNAGNTYSDISFTLGVTASSASRTVDKASISEAGSGPSGTAQPQVTSGMSVVTNATTYSGLTTSLSSLTASVPFTPFNPTVSAPLNLNVDLKVSTLPGTGGNAGPVLLTSSTLEAPEPASIALFATAIAGLTAGCRRKGRAQQQT